MQAVRHFHFAGEERNFKSHNGRSDMSTSAKIRICLAVLLTAWLGFIASAHAQIIDVPAKLVQVIPLTHIEGWMDHMSVDVKTNRLFLPAQHKSSIEVIDLKT